MKNFLGKLKSILYKYFPSCVIEVLYLCCIIEVLYIIVLVSTGIMTLELALFSILAMNFGAFYADFWLAVYASKFNIIVTFSILNKPWLILSTLPLLIFMLLHWRYDYYAIIAGYSCAAPIIIIPYLWIKDIIRKLLK